MKTRLDGAGLSVSREELLLSLGRLRERRIRSADVRGSRAHLALKYIEFCMISGGQERRNVHTVDVPF